MLINFEIFIFVIALTGLVFQAFSSDANIFSWKMFEKTSICRMKLSAVKSDGSEIPLNSWEFLPHTHISMSAEEAKFFLAYLGCIHDLAVNGTILFSQNGESVLWKVDRCHVAN